MLERLIADRLVDFVAMDVKAPLARYHDVARVAVPTEDLRKSIELILVSGLHHEFRTTFVESLLAPSDMQEIARLVKGCRKYVMQAFRTGKLLDAGIAEKESSHRLSGWTELRKGRSGRPHGVRPVGSAAGGSSTGL